MTSLPALAGGVTTLVAAAGGSKILLLVGAAIAGLACGMLINNYLMGRKRRK
jgi:hypothetical protein